MHLTLCHKAMQLWMVSSSGIQQVIRFWIHLKTVVSELTPITGAFFNPK